MGREQFRLECLRLALSRTANHQDGLARAEEFYEFCKKPDEDPLEEVEIVGEEPRKRGRPPKIPGNAKL